MHSGMLACQGSGRCLHSGETKESVVFIQACQGSGVDLQVCGLNSIRIRSPRPFISVQIIIVIKAKCFKALGERFFSLYMSHLFFFFLCEFENHIDSLFAWSWWGFTARQRRPPTVMID